MKIVSLTLLALLLISCSSLDSEQLDRHIGREVVRDTTNNELDQWSDERIDDAAGDICDLLRDGKAMSADRVYLALRDDELRGISPRAGAALFAYAQRYEC